MNKQSRSFFLVLGLMAMMSAKAAVASEHGQPVCRYENPIDLADQRATEQSRIELPAIVFEEDCGVAYPDNDKIKGECINCSNGDRVICEARDEGVCYRKFWTRTNDGGGVCQLDPVRVKRETR